MKDKIAIIMCMLIIVLPLAQALEISGVTVTAVTERSAKLKFTTDEPSLAEVWWGTNSSRLSNPPKITTELAQNYTIPFTDLKNATAYYALIKAKTADSIVIDNNSGKYYSFTTLAADTVPPFINASLPAWWNKQRIDVYGNVEPDSQVMVYINSALWGKDDVAEDGYFIFPDVKLENNIANKIKLEVTDHAGNKNEKEFSVSVDYVKPVLNMTVKEFYDKNPALVSGTVSEEATLNVYRNNSVIASSTVSGAFTASVPLTEGLNDLEFVVSDKANNTDYMPAVTYLDTTPPTFTDVEPQTGSTYYEGKEEITVSGKTKPLTKVMLYYGDSSSSAKTTTSDETGNFEIKGVDLNEYFRIRNLIGSPAATAEELATSLGRKPEETRTAQLKLVAIDRAGLKGEQALSYKIITCYYGGDWNILNIVQYQSPDLLSTDRLESGTEIISFVLNMSYQGLGKDAKVTQLTIDNLCNSADIAKDKKYNVSCKILRRGGTMIQKPNPTNTAWYVRYDNLRLTDANMTPETFSAKWWKSLGKDLEFPLKITVSYTEQSEYNQTRVQKYQIKCLPLSYQLDMTKIDPRKILPEELLDASISGLNKTIEFIDKIEPTFNKIVQITGWSCLGAFGVKIFTAIIRRVVCFWDYYGSKLKKEADKCPALDKQNYLSNTELENKCPSCNTWWGYEGKTYWLYRTACDRFLGHTAPAGFTETEDVSRLTQLRDDALLCTKVESTGVVLKKATGDACARCGIGGRTACYEYKNNHYYWDGNEADTSGTYAGTYILKMCGDVPGPALHVTLDDAQRAFLSADQGNEKGPDCKTFCSKKGWETWREVPADIVLSGAKIDQQFPQGDSYAYIYPSSPGTYVTSNPNNFCECISKTGKYKGAGIDAGDNAWNYRDDKSGYYIYNPLKYYSGRDWPACFGQSPIEHYIFNSDKRITMNPRNLIDSFQCLYVTGIYNRMKFVKSVATAMRNCFQQIKTSGTGTAGVCREVFTQYLCSIASWFATLLISDCSPFFGETNDNPDSSFIRGALKVGATGMYEELGGFEYENTAIQNFLQGGEGAVAKKICMGALTGDWGISMQDIIDAGYRTPLTTSAAAFPADRYYLTFNPDTFNSVYNYDVAWMIAPGCDLQSYTVQLSCVTRKEMLGTGGQGGMLTGIECGKTTDKENPNGCDCLDRTDITSEKTTMLAQSTGEVAQGQFITSSANKNAESRYRYDHVKITLYAKDPKQAAECFPAENRQGNSAVFYSPITDKTQKDVADCTFDQSTGEFRCAASGMWYSRGAAQITAASIVNNQEFYPGGNIAPEVTVWNLGGDKCLYGRVVDSKGVVKSTGAEGWKFIPVTGENIAATYPLALVDSIKTSDVGMNKPDVTPSQAGASVLIEPRAAVKEMKQAVIYYNLTDACLKKTEAECTGRNLGDWELDTKNVKSISGVAKLIPVAGTNNWAIQIDGVELARIGALSSLGTLPSDTNWKRSANAAIAFTITFSISGAPSEKWNIQLQMRYPNNSTFGGGDLCANAPDAPLVVYGGVEQKKDIPINIITGGQAAKGCDKDNAGNNIRCSLSLGANQNTSVKIYDKTFDIKVIYADSARAVVSVEQGPEDTIFADQSTIFETKYRIYYTKFVSNQAGLKVEYYGTAPPTAPAAQPAAAPAPAAAAPASEKSNTPTTPTCTDFTYEDWSACLNGKMTRKIKTSLPAGCTGGTPDTETTCVSTAAPTILPECAVDKINQITQKCSCYGQECDVNKYCTVTGCR